MAAEGSFWDTLQSVGISTVNRITAPISNAVGQTFGNIITGTQNKVAAVTNKIVASTDPLRNANSPAIPPTSAALTAAQQAGISSGVVMAAVAVILLVYFLSKKR